MRFLIYRLETPVDRKNVSLLVMSSSQYFSLDNTNRQRRIILSLRLEFGMNSYRHNDCVVCLPNLARDFQTISTQSVWTIHLVEIRTYWELI